MADLDVVVVTMVPAIDQHLADAGCAHFIECDFDRVGSWSPTHESQLHPKMHPNRVFSDFQSGRICALEIQEVPMPQGFLAGAG